MYPVPFPILAAMLVALAADNRPVVNNRDPHWLRSRKIRKPTKNWRYYQKRVEQRRRNAGR